MTPEIAVAFAQEAAQLNIVYTLFALLMIVGVFGFLVALGQKALGFNTKAFLNHVEATAKRAAKGEPGGTLWPGIALMLGGMGLLGLVLYIGLR